MSSPEFTCRDCGKTFTLPPKVLAKFPGWTPRQCMPCKDVAKGGAKKGATGTSPRKTSPRKTSTRKKSVTAELNLPVAQVLERFTEGPHEGVFTDGACSGNPGPGGWGMVWVENGEVKAQDYGHEPRTTNNRMELRALISAYETLPADAEVTIYSDSNLCVKTINEWAAGWKRKGWKRKTGEVKNLELVQRAYALSLERPKAKLRWIKAHNGSRWNEYADALATAFQRDEL